MSGEPVLGPRRAIEAFVEGRVQGVGYRNFVQRRAVSRRLGGWAQNLADGRVRVRAEGGLAAIEGFVRELEQGPPLARVDRVSVVSVPYSGLYKDFVIRLSDST